jgi:RHS repeat-associated protein
MPIASTTQPNLQAGNYENGWLSPHQRMTDTTDPANPIINMGARVYLPRLAKFTTPDPIEGGVGDADYLYPTDPINGYDLTGMRTEGIGAYSPIVEKMFQGGVPGGYALYLDLDYSNYENIITIEGGLPGHIVRGEITHTYDRNQGGEQMYPGGIALDSGGEEAAFAVAIPFTSATYSMNSGTYLISAVQNYDIPEMAFALINGAPGNPSIDPNNDSLVGMYGSGAHNIYPSLKVTVSRRWIG